MIRRNPEVPDNFFELARHETIGSYARTYGDEIARRYEHLNIIYIPYFPLALDLDFLRALTFPTRLKKVGSVNGIGEPAFKREGDVIGFSPNPVLFNALPQKIVVGYLQQQIADVNWQVRNALRLLFPRYFSLAEGNITWRMTETIDEVMHLDGYHGGKPTPAAMKGMSHRIKLFVNIDSEPRKWRTSYTLPEILKRCRGRFPQGLPDDVDQLAYHLQYQGILPALPYHEVDIPPMGAVLAEGAAIAHAVRYGRRLIVDECHCHRQDMLAPEKQPQAALRGWLDAAGIPVDPIPRVIDPPAGTTAYVA